MFKFVNIVFLQQILEKYTNLQKKKKVFGEYGNFLVKSEKGGPLMSTVNNFFFL